jgi:hypothetical protein
MTFSVVATVVVATARPSLSEAAICPSSIGRREHPEPTVLAGAPGVAVLLGLGGLDVQGPCDPADGPGELDDRAEGREPPGDSGGRQLSGDQVIPVGQSPGVGAALAGGHQSLDGRLAVE